jgi:competence protein ComEC
LRAGLYGRIHGLRERLHSAAHVQFAVTVALAPLTVYWFAQIPLIGPLANAFAIPWVSLLVTPAVLAGVALPAPLDAWALHVAHTLLDLLDAGLHLLLSPMRGRWVLRRSACSGVWRHAAGRCAGPRRSHGCRF